MRPARRAGPGRPHRPPAAQRARDAPDRRPDPRARGPAAGGPLLKRIGVVDTTFARVDLARYAVRALGSAGTGFRLVRRTVPGIKDLPVACRQLFAHDGVDLCLALGMPGRQEYDKVCAHEASLGLILTGVLEAKPIVECFVFEGEADSPEELEQLGRRRAEEHALNAYALLFRPHELSRHAGEGLRQGFPDAGPVRRMR